MISGSKFKILVWLVVILFAINVSTVVSLYVHTKRTGSPAENHTTDLVDRQAERGVSQFREHLNLDAAQIIQFRDINREYNRTAGQITRQLEFLRIDMVNELGKSPADMEKIREINTRFGQLHEQLKNRTAEYYLQMNEVCNEEQKQKLYELFSEMVQTDESRPAGSGRRRGRAWRGE
jgi:Spy/CpxP family protein refolding chaperone